MLQELANEYADRWLHAPDAFDLDGGLWLLYFGQSLAKPTYRIGPRQIEHYSLHFVLEGQVEFHYGDKKKTLSKGDMFCKFPGVTHMHHTVSGSEPPLRLIWMAFSGRQVPQLLELAGFANGSGFRRHVLDKGIELLLQQIAAFTKQVDHKGKLITLYGMLYQLFGKLAASLDHQLPRHKPDHWIRRSVDFIHAHYYEQITVVDMAGYVGYHRTHFSRTFARLMGMPPMLYLQQVRLDKALQLLLDTSLTVTEVALTVGYPDIYTFTRAFTRQYGKSPKEARKSGGV